VLQAAGWPDAATPVLVVGHQPTLGNTLGRVLGTQHCSIDKGAAWWLRTRRREGHLQVDVRTVQSPETV
jgi:phosphohistidine phosphatase